MRYPSTIVPESSGRTRIPRRLGDSREFVGGPGGTLFGADPFYVGIGEWFKKWSLKWKWKRKRKSKKNEFEVPRRSRQRHKPNSARRSTIASSAAAFSPAGCSNCHSITNAVALLIQGPFGGLSRLCMISAPFTRGLSSNAPSRSLSTIYARNWLYSRTTVEWNG